MMLRSIQATAKPLATGLSTVAGRCKPMKVEKPKRNRVHKVKQGRRPKLSASQKRKLVRLYIFTNLSWKVVSDLVLHFGSEDIKLRALQYLLRGFYSAHYNQLRPKDANEMRERISQVQRCRQLKLAEHDTHEKTKSLPRPVVNHQHRATKHAVGSYSKTPIEDTILSIDRAPVRVLEEDEARSDEFESFLNHYWNDELERSNPDQESWLFSNPHQFGSLNPIMSTSSPQVSMTDHASLQYSDTTSNIDSSITGGPLESESLPASGSSSSGTYTGVDALMTDFRPTVSLLNLPGLENELGGLQNGELAVSDTNPSLKSRADRSSDIRNDAQMMRSRLRSQEPNRIYAACIPLETQARSLDHIQDLRAPRASSTADLSHLLDRLSISSMGDRRLIEDLLDNSSGPSSSTRSSSRFSIGSSGRFQETHLMARIRSGASEDKDIEELIRADTDINAQNTRGETALHLSVKLGKMSATTALLNRGANVHLKNTMGEGVLAVAQNAQRRAKEDESLYARIAACMAMAMAAGAVAAPVTTPPLIQEHPRPPPVTTQTQEGDPFLRTKHHDSRYWT